MGTSPLPLLKRAARSLTGGHGRVEPRCKRIKRLRSPTSSAIATNWPGPGQDFALEDRKRVRNSFLANADPLGADVSP